MRKTLSSLALALALAAPAVASAQTIPAGTPVSVRIDQRISTHHASAGDTWTGTLTRSVVVRGRTAFPAGSAVRGVVSQSVQGTHSTKAQIALAVRSIDGRSVRTNRETIVADSHRAKKIGAIAVGAAAGALVGHAVAEHGHGTLIGGVLGGATGYGATRHAMRTLVLKPGTELTFTTREDLVARR